VSDKLVKFSRYIHLCNEQAKTMARILTEEYKDRPAQIVCPHFNDQIAGTSKPKLKGKVYTINEIDYHDGELLIDLKGLENFVTLGQIKIL
jgi:hypothetical protein